MALVLFGKSFQERTAVKRIYMIIRYNDNPPAGKHLADIRGGLRQYVIFNVDGIELSFPRFTVSFIDFSYYMLFPITLAIWETSLISSSYFRGFNDWAPSHSAFSGSCVTSTISPSAPAAMEALPLEFYQPPFASGMAGSTITGRWVRGLRNTGMLCRSSVLRV